jgi:MFS transporter, DHA1 family, inner membrane transport protein
MTTATVDSAARSHATLLNALAFGNFIVGMGAFMVIGLLTPMAYAFHISKADAAMTMTVYAISYAIASPLLVAATGTIDRRTLLISSLAIFVLACAFSALAESPATLFAARILAAIGAGLFTPSTSAVAVSVSEPSARPAALAKVFSGLTFSQVLGVPVGGYLGFKFGWHSAFWAVTLLGLLGLLVLYRLVPRALAFQPTSLAALVKVLSTPAQVVAVLFTTTFMGAIYVVYTFLSPLVELRLAMGGDGVALILIAAGVGAVLGNLLGARLTRALGAYRALLLLALLQVLLLPTMTLVPFGLVSGLILTVVWSTCGWSVMVPQQMRLVSLAPQAQGVVLALNAAAIYVAASLGSALGGQVFTRSGLAETGIAGGAVAMLGVVHLLLSIRLERRARS